MSKLSEREEAYQYYSDTYKDIHGIRPTWMADVFRKGPRVAWKKALAEISEDAKKDIENEKNIYLENHDIYIKQMTGGEMYLYFFNNFKNAGDLTKNVMRDVIDHGFVFTKHEIDIAYEELSVLNDWPDGEGFGTSDKAWELKKVRQAVSIERNHINSIIK